MRQLTILNLADDLDACVRRLAEVEGISHDEAALKLLRKGAGLADFSKPSGPVGNSLDHLFGIWTEEEAADFDASVAVFEVIDEEAWK